MRAVILDRDWVLNEEIGGVNKFKDFKLLPNTAEAIKNIHNAWYLAIVITNQSAIDKWKLTWDELHKMEQVLYDIGIDAIFTCPHYKQNCPCRKPKTYLFKRAAIRYKLDLSECYTVGDSTRDIQAWHDAWTKTVWVLTGKGCKDKECKIEPDEFTTNLFEWTKKIC